MADSPDRDALGYVDINLMVLLRYLVHSWRFILVSLAFVLTLTSCNLRNSTATYQATMVVAPMEDDAGGGASGSQSLTTRFLNTLTTGGSGGGGQRFDEFKYLLTAPSTINAANVDGKLYSWLYGSAWNPQTRTFLKPSGLNQELRSAVRRFFRRPEWYPQDSILTAQMLSEQVVVSQLPKSTLVVLTYDNPDPRIAAAVLGRLYSITDRVMRDNQRSRLKAQIANANDMLSETQLSDLRMAMAQQLASSQYRLMNVPDNINFAAKTLEAPYVSPIPVSPRPGRTLMIVFVMTVFLSAFVSVGYQILRAQYDARGEVIPLLDPAHAWARAAWRKMLSK